MTPEIATRADWGVFSQKQVLQNLFGAGWRQPDVRVVFNPQPHDFGDVDCAARACLPGEEPKGRKDEG